jgi:hypothetical protein
LGEEVQERGHKRGGEMTDQPQPRRITHDEWVREGMDIFGEECSEWEFKCPNCGCVQSFDDWVLLGIRPSEIGHYLGYCCLGVAADNGLGCDCSLADLPELAALAVDTDDGVRLQFDFARGVNDER